MAGARGGSGSTIIDWGDGRRSGAELVEIGIRDTAGVIVDQLEISRQERENLKVGDVLKGDYELIRIEVTEISLSGGTGARGGG